MKNVIIYTLTAATILASAATFAQAAGNDGKRGGGHHRGPNIEKLIERLDANQDGGISLDEIKTSQTDLFSQVDADGDASLTEEEFAMIKEIRGAERKAKAGDGQQTAQKDDKENRKGRYGKGKRGPSFERLDADNSGSLSLSEFTDHADKMFERMDRNSDGIINADDIKRKNG